MNKWLVGLVILIVVIGGYFVWSSQKTAPSTTQTIKIGLVSALSGDFAFYGESTRAGVLLAQKDLADEGINIEIIAEDGQFDTVKSLSAAQKLVNIDGVQAIYSDFNPEAIAISSFIKGKNILHVYDAAPVSPLQDNPLVYKSYIDFMTGCRNVAQYLKDKGIKTVGILSINIEAGDLCTEGVKDIYGDTTFVEKYNPDTMDFRTQLLKLKQNNVQAVFNVALPSATISSLKDMRTLKMSITFVASSDSISPDIISQNSTLLEGVVAFGLVPASDDFIQKLKQELPNQNVGYYPAAALAYIHTKQMALALKSCNSDTTCMQNEMDNTPSENAIGFGGFKNHVAEFALPIQEFRNGKFETVQ